MTIQPIFLFSISRSGSTLTQRIIAAHDGVATVSEPWVLLPQLYAFRREGTIAEYVHPLMVTAIEDFCQELPKGAEDYRQELRDFVLRLYEKAAGNDARYFLDKSPYYTIVDDVMRLFPEGKFIFLWRNPLSIISSIIQTWDHAKWRPTLFTGDLFTGLPRLVDAYRANSACSHSVRFEDIVDGNEQRWTLLMDYLGIEFQPETLHSFSDVKLHGRMGDPTGVKRYQALSAEPNQKWKGTLANPLRRAWCHRYLRFLGNDRLAVMGYDGDRLIEELDSQPMSMNSLIPDLGRAIVDVAKEPIRVRIRHQGLGGPNVIRELLMA
jgi:hypothetical protein